jgi:hypothetical protein
LYLITGYGDQLPEIHARSGSWPAK